MTPSGVITVSGTVISLIPGGSVIVVGSSTEALGDGLSGGAAAITSVDVGAVTWSAFGGGAGSGSESGSGGAITAAKTPGFAIGAARASIRPLNGVWKLGTSLVVLLALRIMWR